MRLLPITPEMGRVGSCSYAERGQRVTFVRWLAERVRESGLSRKEIARALWPASAEGATTHQVKRYLEVRTSDKGPVVTLPAPKTLRSLCALLGVSWVEAFAIAGYYREILWMLARLADLGHLWMSEDGAPIDNVFRNFGILEFGQIPTLEALRTSKHAARYTLGFWEEGPYETEFEFPEDMDPEAKALIEARHRREDAEVQRVCVVAPKPLAVAIAIAVSAFPRRGDVYKDDVSRYGAELLIKATPLVELAERRSKLRSLPALLESADRSLKDRNLSLEQKRVIAAELVVAWADRECNRYTHFIRLATMDEFGVAGNSTSRRSAETGLPQIRRAQLPSPNVLIPDAEIKPQ